MDDAYAYDHIKAAGWAKGYEDGARNAPQSPVHDLGWSMLDSASFRAYSQAYHEGYGEGQRRIELLQARQELDRLFDELANESRR